MFQHSKNMILLAALLGGTQAAAVETTASTRTARAAGALQPCSSVAIDPPTFVTLGKSSVIRLAVPAVRMLVGGQSSTRVAAPAAGSQKPGAPAAAAAAPAPAAGAAADGVAGVEITLLSPTELFFLGKKSGSMNVVLQAADGRCLVKDIFVTVDPSALQGKLTELMPEETGITVRGAENALVLTGKVSDAIKLDEVMSLATSYGDGRKVVNMLRIMTPQQVMIEVKIAEVSKTMLDRFGLDFTRLFASGGTSTVLSGIIGGGAAVLGRFSNSAGGTVTGRASGLISGVGSSAATNLSATGGSASLLGIDAQKKDGLVRILAEPNIMAISGQGASFLSGGKIFIPVAQANTGGGTTTTLEEKEFGVGLRFTPTVLDGTRVNLKLVSEVSELSQTGSPFTTVGGVTSVLPSITTRRVDTTVQLNDGQSFVVAGLIKNNVTEAIKRFPGLGEVPVMGALFRSTEFLNDQTELMFIVTPRLVKPLTTAVVVPTDNHVVPTRAEVILMGATEGKPRDPAPPVSSSVTAPAASTLSVTANAPSAEPPAPLATPAPATLLAPSTNNP